jgi:pyruvate formate lyase activating enzyme
MANLKKMLLEMTKPSDDLVDKKEGETVQCHACAQRCTIREGGRGVCMMRVNEGGRLHVPFGYVGGMQLDPVEKKPLFHFLPGSTTLSYGMLGCNLHCSFCQNWYTSQTLRDEQAGGRVQPITPEEMIETAKRRGARAVVSTYNEPLITTEWNVAIFKRAREAGLKSAYVSNGYATPETLDYLEPWLDAYKIDLKTMDDAQYRALGGGLQPVLDTIKGAWARGMWVEVVTLVIPGYNDAPESLRATADFIASVSPDIPWHVTAYHPDYQYSYAPPTPAESLLRAVEIGEEVGLHYIYAGNLPGTGREDTRCPECAETVVRRRGFYVMEDRVEDGACPNCGESIAGVWT